MNGAIAMKSDGFGDARIQVNFDVERPVELVQLTLALQALARDYRRYANEEIRNRGGKVSDDDIRLYVTKVETGSIIAELGSAAQVMGAFLPLIAVDPLFSGYVQFFGQSAAYFTSLASRGGLKPSDITTTKAAAQSMSDILDVVASMPNSKFKLSAKVTSCNADGSEYAAQLTLTSEEAVKARRGALIAQKILEYRGDAQYENVMLYFQQTSTDKAKLDGRTADRAIVNAVSPKALPVHFASQLDAARVNDMKSDPRQNPFKAAFRVDMNVETDRNHVPRFYRVLHIHEVIPDDSNEP
jgi:hypothetical protein